MSNFAKIPQPVHLRPGLGQVIVRKMINTSGVSNQKVVVRPLQQPQLPRLQQPLQRPTVVFKQTAVTASGLRILTKQELSAPVQQQQQQQRLPQPKGSAMVQAPQILASQQQQQQLDPGSG